MNPGAASHRNTRFSVDNAIDVGCFSGRYERITTAVENPWFKNEFLNVANRRSDMQRYEDLLEVWGEQAAQDAWVYMLNRSIDIVHLERLTVHVRS